MGALGIRTAQQGAGVRGGGGNLGCAEVADSLHVDVVHSAPLQAAGWQGAWRRLLLLAWTPGALAHRFCSRMPPDRCVSSVVASLCRRHQRSVPRHRRTPRSWRRPTASTVADLGRGPCYRARSHACDLVDSSSRSTVRAHHVGIGCKRELGRWRGSVQYESPARASQHSGLEGHHTELSAGRMWLGPGLAGHSLGLKDV